MTTKQLNRRLFLQGFGGVAVAAPFLGSMLERTASGAASADPQRLIVFFTHYGCITNRWFPKKSHGELVAADYEGTPTLKSLAPYAKKLLMVRGVRSMNEWSFTQELGQETDPHTQVMNAYFTGCPTDGVSGLGATPSGVNSATPKRKMDGKPVGGRSLDHICAEQINRSSNPTPLYISLGGQKSNDKNTMISLSFSTEGVYDHAKHAITTQATLFPAVVDPNQIYSNITKLFGTGTAPVMTDGSYAVSSGKHLLDLCKDDLMRLKAKAMSAADKMKIEAWENLLTDTTSMMGMGPRTGCSADAGNKVGVTDQAIKDGASSAVAKGMPIMSSLVALSALCDDNRVIFLKTPGNYTYSNLDGIKMDHHSLSHRQGDANQGGGKCVADVNNLIAKIDTYHAESFANLVKILDGVPEGAGTLLDNTATVWFQELSDGNSHNLNNIPILQAGGAGGYFKLGQAINVDGGAPDMSPGTSEALCTNTAGGDAVPSGALDSTGTPKTIANAPINKYFCNLMNAIGVKAGADGFAAKGGTQEVTHFGMYDDTKDFIGFLKDTPPPPKINNPNEFKELKA